LRLNEHIEHEDGATVFRHACKARRHRLEAEGFALAAVKREAEEDWGH